MSFVLHAWRNERCQNLLDWTCLHYAIQSVKLLLALFNGNYFIKKIINKVVLCGLHWIMSRNSVLNRRSELDGSVLFELFKSINYVNTADKLHLKIQPHPKFGKTILGKKAKEINKWSLEKDALMYFSWFIECNEW